MDSWRAVSSTMGSAGELGVAVRGAESTSISCCRLGAVHILGAHDVSTRARQTLPRYAG